MGQQVHPLPPLLPECEHRSLGRVEEWGSARGWLGPEGTAMRWAELL